MLAPPAIWLFGLYCLIDFQRQCECDIVPLNIGRCLIGDLVHSKHIFKIVIQSSFSGSIQLFRCFFRLTGFNGLHQLGDLLQVLLVFNGLGLARLDDLIQQFGHLVVKRRVVEMLLDDLAAHIILDGLCHRIPVALQTVRQ